MRFSIAAEMVIGAACPPKGHAMGAWSPVEPCRGSDIFKRWDLVEGNWVMARLSSPVGTRSGIVPTRMGSFEWLPPDFCFFAGMVLLHRLCFCLSAMLSGSQRPSPGH